MKHMRCYACKKLGNIAKECRNKVWAPYQKEKTSSQSKIWKKKEVQSEICGIAEYTDITDSEGVESVEAQCYKSHMQVSRRQVVCIRDFEVEQSHICWFEEKQWDRLRKKGLI